MAWKSVTDRRVRDAQHGRRDEWLIALPRSMRWAAAVLGGLVTSGLVGASAVAAQSNAEYAGRLTSRQIVQLLSNNSTQAQMPLESGETVLVTIFYAADGSTQFVTSTGVQDTGRWTVTPDNLYCSQWENLRQGKKSCSVVLVEDDVVHFVDNTTEFVTRLVRGNAIR